MLTSNLRIKDDPFYPLEYSEYPHYHLAAEAIIRQFKTRLTRRRVKNLNTIDADPDAFGLTDV